MGGNVAKSFVEHLRSQGVTVRDNDVRMWPIEWIAFRPLVEAHWPAVGHFQEAWRNGAEWDPVILCSKCFCILDGWHRVAAAWRSGRHEVPVIFADTHFYGQVRQDFCRADLTPWLETLRPWAEMDCVSGAYHQKDFSYPPFGELVAELRAFGGAPPNTKTRLWERARAVIFLGRLVGKRILDVGTRESLVPHYLASKQAEVTAVDLDEHLIVDDGSLTVRRADVRELPFEASSFDAVICTSCIKFVPERGDSQAMVEMIRVLRPGGLLAVSFDFWTEYREYPSEETGRRIYDRAAIYQRLVEPVSAVAKLCGPVDFDRTDWNDWPFRKQAREICDRGVNLQVASILLRKKWSL